jgi:hypothetical protein
LGVTPQFLGLTPGLHPIVASRFRSDCRLIRFRTHGLTSERREWKKQLLGSASRVFEEPTVKPSLQEQRREAELQRLKNVIAEITAENLELKKGPSG